MAIQLKTYRFKEATKKGYRISEHTVLVDDRGYKYLHVLMMDGTGLTVRKVPKDHERYMRDVIQGRKLPSLATTINKFRKFGKRVGMTKAAKSFLTDAMKAA